METKLHISLVALKALMLKTPTTIVKKTKTTSDVGPIICVSSPNARKTQVRLDVTIKWKAQKWAKINVPPNGSPCHVPNPNKMIMKSPCQKAWKKI